jgi:hypothetical protein
MRDAKRQASQIVAIRNINVAFVEEVTALGQGERYTVSLEDGLDPRLVRAVYSEN